MARKYRTSANIAGYFGEEAGLEPDIGVGNTQLSDSVSAGIAEIP
jgi:hypothetical protein